MVELAAAKVLQASLLPSALPQVPGLEFATRYVPAEIVGIGGDWYDAFTLPDGRLWIMVGDVMGHGLHSAVVMGRLRSTLRAYALAGHSPEEVLRLADRKLQFFEPGETATVLCAAAAPPYDSITVSLAGHLPPIVAEAGSAATPADIEPGLLLGFDDRVPRVSTTVPLPPGALMAAYTDGLVERRGQPLEVGLAELCSAVRAEPPEQSCHRIMDSLVGRHAPQDDIALMVIRRRPDW